MLGGQRAGGDGRRARRRARRASRATTEPSAPCRRTAKKRQHAMNTRATARPTTPAVPSGRDWAGLADRTRAVMPSPAAARAARPRRRADVHFSTRTPSRAVTPRPAATLACTRKAAGHGGRGRPARSRETWQTNPNRYVRCQASRSSSWGSKVWCTSWRPRRPSTAAGWPPRTRRSSPRGRTSPATSPAQNRPLEVDYALSGDGVTQVHDCNHGA